MPKPFIICLILTPLFFSSLPAFSNEKTTPLVAELVKELNKLSVTNVDEAVPVLRKFMGPRFVASSHSHASQGEQRILLSKSAGTLIIGIGASDPNLEVVEDNDGEVVNYEISFEKIGKSTQIKVEKKPGACVSCHTEDFVYIWGFYNKWPHYHGADDDFQDPEDKNGRP